MQMTKVTHLYIDNKLVLDVVKEPRKMITYEEPMLLPKNARVRFMSCRDPSLNDETNCDIIYAKEHPQPKKYKRMKFLACRDPSLNDETNCDKIYAKEHPDEDPNINYEKPQIIAVIPNPETSTYLSPEFTKRKYPVVSRREENKRFPEFLLTLDRDIYEASELRKLYEKFFNTEVTPRGFGKLKSITTYFKTDKELIQLDKKHWTTITRYRKKNDL